MVEPAGDSHTAAYLRYITCLAHEYAGSWSEVRAGTEDMLARLDDDMGPFWRAKVLGLQALALMREGHVAQALEPLAEAYGLLLDNDTESYNRASAFQVVSNSLAVALLIKPATQALTRSAALAGRRPLTAVLSLLERATHEGSYGLLLALLGDVRGADHWFARCAGTAVHSERLAREGGAAEELVVQAGRPVAVRLPAVAGRARRPRAAGARRRLGRRGDHPAAAPGPRLRRGPERGLGSRRRAPRAGPRGRRPPRRARPRMGRHRLARRDRREPRRADRRDPALARARHRARCGACWPTGRAVSSRCSPGTGWPR